jgi:hypothetical protein
MKKMTLLVSCVMFVIITNSLTAQEKNTLGAGFAGPAGFIFGYERAVFDKISVTGEIFIYYHLFRQGLGYTWGLNARGKYYFWENTLFAELGLGFGEVWVFKLYDDDDGTGLLFSPGIGYRFDPGQTAGFCFIPSVKLDIITTGQVQFRLDAFFGYSW